MVRAALIKMIMSKSNDTTKTRELTEAELAAVSGGGSYLENTLINVVARGGGTVGGGTGTGKAGWWDILISS
jgi:bacteriocin-like protein